MGILPDGHAAGAVRKHRSPGRQAPWLLLAALAACTLLAAGACSKQEAPDVYTARRTVEAEELLRRYQTGGEIDAVPFHTEIGGTASGDLALVTWFPGEGGFMTSLYRKDHAVWRWMGEKPGGPGPCLAASVARIDRAQFDRIAQKLAAGLPKQKLYPDDPCETRNAGWALYTGKHFVTP